MGWHILLLYLERGMNQEQRKLFAKGLVDLANLVAAALIFGQFVSGQPISIVLVFIGFIIAFGLYLAGYRFSRAI